MNKYDGDNIEEKASTGLLVKVDTIVCLRGTDLGTESAKVLSAMERQNAPC